MIREPNPDGAARIRILGWAIFAIAFGYTEAVTVGYIRRILGMPPGLDYRQILGPGLRSGAVHAALDRHGIITMEMTREIATIVLLASASFAGARETRYRLGLFLFTFAIWDLSYYLFLDLLIGFPSRLTNTDVYFLLPIATFGPVWFPVLIVMPLLLIASWRCLNDAGRS